MSSSRFEYTPFWHHQVSKFKVLAAKKYPRPLIALFGDSLTEAFQANEFLPNISFANRGISGDVAEAAIRRLDDSLITLKPDTILMMFGTNDIGLGYSDEEILQNYGEMLSRIQAHLPVVSVYVQSILPTRDDLTRPSHRITALNGRLEELASNFNCNWLNLHTHFVDEDGRLAAAFTSDGLHLNGNAYQVWANILKNILTSSSTREQL